MGVLREIHTHFAGLVIVGNGMAGAWSLAAHWVDALRLRSLWWFVVLAQSLLFVQAGLGVGLVTDADAPLEGFHMFYGFLTLACVAILFGYRSGMKRWRYLLYGWGGLFLMGLAIRATLVG